MNNILIADSGGTKTTWACIQYGTTKTITTHGIAPYLIPNDTLIDIITSVKHKLYKTNAPQAIFYFGTGCGNIDNVKKIKQALKNVFGNTAIQVSTDLDAVAKALCGHEKGIACILGTGSNVGFYDGKKIIKTSPGVGYILGDEGSGAYLGKQVLQHFLYKTFDEDLMHRFNTTYALASKDIFDHVYRQPFANRYIASFANFLSENKGHYMIDNIIIDGLNDFFFAHLLKFGEVWKYPIHFSGGVAKAFATELKELTYNYGFTMGTITADPIKALVKFYKES
jgi:glucosamine kinase